MKEITVRINKELNNKISAISNKIGVPKNALIKIILFNYLNNDVTQNL